MKGGHRSTGEKSRGGTLEKEEVSHHRVWWLDCCEDLGGTQLQGEEEGKISMGDGKVLSSFFFETIEEDIPNCSLFM